MKHRYIYRRRKGVIFRAVCIMIILLITLLVADAKLRPAIYELAVLEADAVAAKTINSAVEKALSETGVDYADAVSISRTENGAVTGITTDIVKLNLFKSRITNAVDSAFREQGSAKVSVALGSASGITFLSGFGPYIDVDIGLSSSTRSDFENTFESAGINQTRHSIMLNVESRVILTMSGRRVTRNITTSFCVAQTVIVGAVPDVMIE